MKHIPSSLSILVTSLLATLIIFAISSRSSDTPELESKILGIELKADILESDKRLSARELITVQQERRTWDGTEQHTTRPYLYAFLSFTNRGDSAQTIVLGNRSRNYYQELLVPHPFGAITLHTQGDTVPASSAAIKHHRMAFPLTIAPGQMSDYILELHGPRGILFNPSIKIWQGFLDGAIRERSLIAAIFAICLLSILLDLYLALAIKRQGYLALAVLALALTLFSIRQSRYLLLLIDPLAYPEWLYPLTIALNLSSVIFYISTIIQRDIRAWQKNILMGILLLCGAFALLSMALRPYLMADMLNILSLIAFAFILGISLPVFLRKHRQLLPIPIAFIPWAATMVADILAGILAIRLQGYAEYRQFFGLAASLFMLPIAHLNKYLESEKEERITLSSRLEHARNENARRIAGLASIKDVMLRDLAHELHQSLDTIGACAGILSRKYHDPTIDANCQIILDEADIMKTTLGAGLGGNERSIIDRTNSHNSQNTTRTNSPAKVERGTPIERIVLFDADPHNAMRNSLILQAAGFQSTASMDKLAIVNDVLRGEVSVLIIDPLSTGEDAFILTSLIRAERSFLQFPILMFSDYHDTSLMRQAYAAGINDFLTRPFDSAELSIRIQSLLRLKNISASNQDLQRAEREKAAFLYFLTHNVNTPLTLMLNAIRELRQGQADEETTALLNELELSSSEINEIVQNVLISFRLSDGRQQLRLSAIDTVEIAQRVMDELSQKANRKRQAMSFEAADGEITAWADHSSTRGILYNLIDNAIKFTPREGRITVRIHRGVTVRIEVEDSGPGVQDGDRERLFCRFEPLSTKPTAGEASTGIGLHVARELAVLNGGDLAYLQDRAGACFVLSLPSPQEKHQQHSTELPHE